MHTLIASLTKGAKPTSRALHRGFVRDVHLATDGNQTFIQQDLRHGQDYEVIMVEVPRNPSEFMAAAQKAGHPWGGGQLVRISADVARAVEDNLEWPEHRLLAHRAEMLNSDLTKPIYTRACQNT